MERLLVTGLYRSGTTLLEKLLHQRAQLSVASQPFGLLFFESKQRFLDELGVRRRYPLGHLCGESAYQPSQLAEFLDRDRWSAAELAGLFDRLEAYSGLWTPEILEVRDQIKPGTFLEVLDQLLDAVARLFPKDDLRYVGAKEILCEEYIPYLEERGFRVLSIIRDPRDVIASFDFNTRDNQAGADRPVLHSVRLWRKSVALALEYQGRPGFRWLCYEDLASRAGELIAEIGHWLGLDGGGQAGELIDQRGRLWASNSSYSDGTGVFTSSIGRYRTRVPADVVRFIEALCGPEMEALGYLPERRAIDEADLRRYRDPFEELHARFEPGYSSDPRRLDRELERLVRLEGKSLDETAARRWFIGPRAYRRLRERRPGEPPLRDLGGADQRRK